jgi:hypothetical protein
MAVSQEIRDAEKATRTALLEAITAKVTSSTSVSQLLQLAEAYNKVTSTEAPRDASAVRSL